MRVDLLGVPLDVLSEPEVVGRVMGALAAGAGGWVMTPNLDHLRQVAASAELRSLYEEADLVVADGTPLVWATRLAGSPLPGRIAGSDLVWSLAGESALRGHSLFLLGGDAGVADLAAATLRSRYRGLRIAGTHFPPFGFERDPAEVDKIRAALRDARPDLVYVALGFPKQERVIQELRGELPAAWFMGVGISLSFIAGAVPRAPDALQRVGLEWLHRMALEPRRLARRYLLGDLPFAARLAVVSARARRRGGLETRPAPFDARGIEPVRATFTHGALERSRFTDQDSLTGR